MPSPKINILLFLHVVDEHCIEDWRPGSKDHFVALQLYVFTSSGCVWLNNYFLYIKPNSDVTELS